MGLFVYLWSLDYYKTDFQYQNWEEKKKGKNSSERHGKMKMRRKGKGKGRGRDQIKREGTQKEHSLSSF